MLFIVIMRPGEKLYADGMRAYLAGVSRCLGGARDIAREHFADLGYERALIYQVDILSGQVKNVREMETS